MAEQELKKRIPEEIASRFSLNSFVKKGGGSVRSELRGEMPKLIERALDNPSGTFQMVMNEQSAILNRIDLNILELKEIVGELGTALSKNKRSGRDDDDDSDIDGIIPRFRAARRRGLGRGAALKQSVKDQITDGGDKKGKKGKGRGKGKTPIPTAEPKGSFFGKMFRRGGAKVAAGAAIASNLELPKIQTDLPDGAVIKQDTPRGTRYVDPETQKFIKNEVGIEAEKQGKAVTREEFNKAKATATPTGKPPAVAPDILKVPPATPTTVANATPAASKKVERGVIKKSIAKVLGSRVAKTIAKVIPGVGLLVGLGAGAARAMSGDLAGAAAEVGSGVAGLVPGVGTAASIATDVGLAARDVYQDVYGVLPEKDPMAKERSGEVYDEVKNYVSSFVGKEPLDTRAGEREAAIAPATQTNSADLPALSASPVSGTMAAELMPFNVDANRTVPERVNPEESNMNAISTMIDERMAALESVLGQNQTTILQPGGSATPAPRFQSPAIPTSLGIVAMRSQGLADVYPHPLSGPTMQNSDRGGENLFQ